MTNDARTDRASTPLPRARFVTVVWGAEFTEWLVQLAWRSLLAPGNLPALRGILDAVYTIYICEDDIPQLERSPQLSRMRELADVEIRGFPARDILENRYSWHHTVWSGAVKEAQENGDVVFLVIPDMVFFDGTLERWANHIVDGKRAIFTIGTWVVEETFVPEFTARTAGQELTVVSPAEGMDYLLRHMHPLAPASLLDSRNHLYHMDRISQTVDGSAMVSRIFSSQPLVFDPGHFVLGAGYRPANRLADIVMDPICSFSTGSLLHVSEFYYGQPALTDERLSGLASWGLENLGKTAAVESRFDYVYKQVDTVLPGGVLERVDAELDGRVDDILALGEIVKLWRFLLDRGQVYPSMLLALGNFHFKMFRDLRVDGAYTAFVPVTPAFADDFENIFTLLAEGNSPVGLVDFVKCHIVPKRLYLLPGARVQFHWDNGRDSVPTLGDGYIEIFPPGKEAPPEAVPVPRQQRCGNAVIYPVEKLLVDPRIPPGR